MSSLNIEVLIVGVGPAVDRVKEVLHRALREEVSQSEWHLTVKHMTAEHDGFHGSDNLPQFLLRANNVK